jgi:hypothetical protein
MVNNELILVEKGNETKQHLTKSDMNIKTQTKQYPLPTEVILQMVEFFKQFIKTKP